MSWKVLCSQIDPSCYKRYFTKSEYKRIKKNAIRVNSTDLYDMYGGDMSYQEFYTMLKNHFYYDKYVCEHGIEFYYYIKFSSPREENIKYKEGLEKLSTLPNLNPEAKKIIKSTLLT